MQRFVRRLSTITFVGLTVAAAAVSGCGSDSSSGSATGTGATIAVTDALVNKPVSGQPNAAVYAVITNETSNKITIVGARSSVSDNVQLHLTVDGAGETSAMEQIDSVDIAAGDRYSFEPGGAHIMLMDVNADSFPDDKIDVTLVLNDGTEVPFVAGVNTLESSQMDDPDGETSSVTTNSVP